MKTSKINYTVLTAAALIIVGGGVAAFTGLKALNLVQEARMLDPLNMNYLGYSYQMETIGEQISSLYTVMIGGLLAMSAGLGILGAHVGEWLLEPTKRFFNIGPLTVVPTMDPMSGTVCASLAFAF